MSPALSVFICVHLWLETPSVVEELELNAARKALLKNEPGLICVHQWLKTPSVVENRN
jgi:hypothetical protein